MPWLKTASLITAVLVAILATSLKTFKFEQFEENWLNYRTTCEALKKEIHFYSAPIRIAMEGSVAWPPHPL
jgi:uncharacterized membrane protein